MLIGLRNKRLAAIGNNSHFPKILIASDYNGKLTGPNGNGILAGGVVDIVRNMNEVSQMTAAAQRIGCSVSDMTIFGHRSDLINECQ